MNTVKILLKRHQLWVHKHYKKLRQWFIIFIAMMLLMFSAIMFSRQSTLIRQVKSLSEQNTSLSQQNYILNEQTKKIGKENQVIAKQNRSYTRCIANVFAKYTQDFQPVIFKDLDTCTIEGQSGQANNMFATQDSSSTQKSSSSSKQKVNNPSQPSKPSAQSPQPQPEIKILNCKVDILFLHIGC